MTTSKGHANGVRWGRPLTEADMARERLQGCGRSMKELQIRMASQLDDKLPDWLLAIKAVVMIGTTPHRLALGRDDACDVSPVGLHLYSQTAGVCSFCGDIDLDDYP